MVRCFKCGKVLPADGRCPCGFDASRSTAEVLSIIQRQHLVELSSLRIGASRQIEYPDSSRDIPGKGTPPVLRRQMGEGRIAVRPQRTGERQESKGGRGTMLGNRQATFLIDIGGSGVRISEYAGGKVGDVKERSAQTRSALTRIIKEAADGRPVAGLALSVAGFVNADEGRVILSRNAAYLEGSLTAALAEEFPQAKIHIVNDGEAHARALLRRDGTRFGAINLALGTSVAFGVINEKKQVIRSCGGENWDIGDMPLATRATHNEAYWALGSAGLQELEGSMGSDAYYHYGCRLGTLLNSLAIVFRPKTIGLSGGILQSHADEIRRGVKDEFRSPVCSSGVDIVFQTQRETVMIGLTTLL